MSPFSRDEFIELGITVPTERLIPWATRQLDAARQRQARLQARGVSAATLSAIHDLIGTLEKPLQGPSDAPDLPPESAALAMLLWEEATTFLREARLIAKAEFSTRPDLLAKFRPGVQTGLTLANLMKELESMTTLFREHSSELAALGGTEAFVVRGDHLIKRLKEAKGNLDAASRVLPPAEAQRCHDKGLLYDLTRRLVRVGQLEYRDDPEQAAAFNVAGVARKGGVSRAPRRKEERVGGGKAV